MNILILDTSQSESYVALYCKDVPLARRTFASKDQVKKLLPAIDELLNEAKLTLEEIDLIKVALGPGSFTGTRVGVMTAKALAYGAAIPLVGFHTETGAISPSLEISYTN